MARISTYTTDAVPSLTDKVIGTNVDSNNQTQNYTLSSIVGLVSSNIAITSVLDSISYDNQNPSGTNSALQVEFNGGGGSASDPVSIDALGNITFNQAGTYLLNIFFNVERQGSSGGVATFLIRSLTNGVQNSATRGFDLNSTGIMIPYEETIPFKALAGDILTYEIMRDSSGVNAAGLVAHVNSGPWSDVPSAEVRIWKLSNTA